MNEITTLGRDNINRFVFVARSTGCGGRNEGFTQPMPLSHHTHPTTQSRQPVLLLTKPHSYLMNEVLSLPCVVISFKSQWVVPFGSKIIHTIVEFLLIKITSFHNQQLAPGILHNTHFFISITTF